MTVIDDIGVDKNFVIRTFKNAGMEIDDIDGFITKTKELDEVDAKNQLLQASVMERLVFDLLNQKKLNPNLTFEKNLMALAEGGYKEKGVVVHNLTSLMDGLRDDIFGMIDSKALYNIPQHKILICKMLLNMLLMILCQPILLLKFLRKILKKHLTWLYN